jgi:hypothetical protein
MGTLRGDNGGERPQEDDGLPGLPPEWGTIIIPDDPAELDRDGTQLRRRFRREARHRRWRRRFHLRVKPMGRATEESPGLAVPLLIMAVAVIATLASLFAVAWPDRRPDGTPRLPIRTSDTRVSVGALALIDRTGGSTRISSTGPAVILLVDGCACDSWIRATYVAVAASGPSATASTSARPDGAGQTDTLTPNVAAQGVTATATAGAAGSAPGTVSLLVVAASLPALPALPAAGSTRVRVGAYADPNHSVRAAVTGLPIVPDGPAVVLVDRDGTVLRVVSHLTSITEFQADLNNL